MVEGILVQAYSDEDKGFVINISLDQHQLYIARYNQKFHKKTKIKRSTKLGPKGHQGPFEPCFATLEEAYYGKMARGMMCHAVLKPQKVKCSKGTPIESIDFLLYVI